MPFSSRNFTSEASLKRGGGWVSFFSGVTERSVSVSPSESGGRRVEAPSSFSVSSSSSAEMPYAARYPGDFRVEPEAR